MKTKLKKLSYFLVITILIGCKSISEPQTISKSPAIAVPQIVYVTGNLDNAFSEAAKQNKHLLVVSTYKGYEKLSDGFVKNMSQNQELSRELAINYLIYKCDMANSENNKLKWLFESIAMPTGYIFTPQGSFLNFVHPTTHPSIIALSLKLERNGETSLLARNSDRINVTGLPGITYYNTMILASSLVELGEKSEGLRAYYLFLKKRKYNFFYYYYLMGKMASILELDSEAKFYVEKALGFKDVVSLKLFEDLINELDEMVL